jgi:hypothetical protein
VTRHENPNVSMNTSIFHKKTSEYTLKHILQTYLIFTHTQTRPGEVSAGRVKVRNIKWVSKSKGREQLSIQWELGIRDDGYVPGQVTRNIGLVQCKGSPKEIESRFAVNNRLLTVFPSKVIPCPSNTYVFLPGFNQTI